MNVRQYNGVNRAVKWMSDNTMGKQSSKMNVRHYNGVNRAVKWMSDITMGKTEQDECQTINRAVECQT